MNFEETVNFCKQWYIDNNVEIPKTSRDWGNGRSGVNIPPKCTYQALRKRGIKVGDLLEAINPSYVNRVKNPQNSSDFMKELDLTFIRVEGVESVIFKCNSCQEPSSALKGTLRRWQARGDKHCSICRKASGKSKPAAYYQGYLNSKEFEAISVAEGRVLIKHLECGSTFTRGTGYIVGSQRSSEDLVSCPYCSSYYVHGAAGTSYTSLVEQECIEHLMSIADTKIEREVAYKSLVPINREFRLDVWLPQYSIGIEITSKNNNLLNYQQRLQEKLSVAALHKLDIRVATSKSDIEDIVRSLPKGKES